MNANPFDRSLDPDDHLTVLHVDDDPAFADLTATYLERQHDAFEVRTETDAAAALERLETAAVDCLVSDYDMPDLDGLALLEAVRADHPELPFILFTGKGGEEVASDAISAGVTDYLQKGGGSEAFQLLGNRVVNAVARHRARTSYREIMEKVPDGIVVHDPEDASFVDMNAKYAEMFGYTREEFFEAGFEAIHPGEEPYTADRARELVREAAESGPRTVQWPGVTSDGERIWFEVNLRPATLDGRLRLLAVVRDVSDRRERQRQLEYERDRLAAVFESVPEPLVHIRLDEGGSPRVVRVNDAFADAFGPTPADAEGESLDDLIVPDRLREEADAINRQTVSEDEIEREVVREAHDGERRFLFKAAPIIQEVDAVEWVGTYFDRGPHEE